MTPRVRRIAFAAGLIVTAGAVTAIALGEARRDADLLGSLTRAVRGHAVPGVRLSIISSLHSCEPAIGGCVAPAVSKTANALFRRAEAAAREGADPAALQAAALVNLLFATSSGNRLNQSISYLQSAAAMAERPAPMLADLAGAHLLLAEQNRDPQELFKALDAAQRALQAEPRNVTARYNAAEALDRIGLREQSIAGWTQYLASDATSAWADHARLRLRALSPPQPPQVPAPTATPAEMTAYAAAAPKEARELGWDQLLGEWGGAVLGGDSALAQTRLDQAAALGAALAQGGDASLADATAAIRRRARHRAGIRHLAGLHRDLAEARAAQLATDHSRACPTFRRVLGGADQVALREWALTFVGLCAAYGPGTDASALADLAARANGRAYPALAARRWWVAGVALRDDGRHDEALDAYDNAGRLFMRAAERENAATMRMLAGNTHTELGNAEEGYTLLHGALADLRGFPGSLGLHNVLYALRNATLADGLPFAALRIQDEAVAGAEGMEPFYRAETRLARARLYLVAGLGYGETDVRAAAEITSRLPGGHHRDWLDADLHETRAQAALTTDPARAAVELDSVVAYFSIPARLVPALFTRAEAQLAAGRRESAVADLRRAAELLDRQRAHVESAQLRASLLEHSRRVFDRAVMLSLQAGRTEEALDFVERSRASFSSVGRAADWARRPLRPPEGHVAIELALVGDTLLAWTLAGGSLHLSRTTIARAELLRMIEIIRSALERRAPESAVLPRLESLYDQLIRPISGRLGPAGTPLMIVADGELSAVPIAALRDRERERYLLEDHPLRYASSLRDPVVGAVPYTARAPVTLVADPAFDRRAFPELQPLPGAAAEAAAVEGSYPGARVLAGERADGAAVRGSFTRGGIAHFAGHAVFDDARPERSFLVVAGDGDGARITAAELERMDLRALRLVVLSACQTSRASPGRSGGFAGLAGAFLAAGAGGVVGSLWRVDDGHTRVLMAAFHQAYRESGNPAEALRQAQLGLLRSADPTLRSPSAWASFRYIGG